MAAYAYRVQSARAVEATELTRGPWDPRHQHAGPPVAMVCRAIEAVAAGHGLTHLGRLTANLLRPVPIGVLEIEVDTDYAGRNAAHYSARLLSDGKEVARFTALAQREADVTLPAVAADSGNGISAILDFTRYVFVNADLTINLLRKPQGEWICLEANTLLAPNGCGLAESRLYDEAGLVGRATQTLSVRERS